MPTTFSDIAPVRRVAVGDCSGPLGSGFDALARSAYTSLLAAAWQISADPPFLPVHDNGQTANKTIPRGDAWKCTYGYDAAARTERSACGAVCYSFKVPADALSGTPANIASVSMSLTGDRYLDAGVDLYVVRTGSANPPSIAYTISNLTPAGTYCATSDQSPTPPNERHGVTEHITVAVGDAATAYLHVILALHDYASNRDAWIEGGAMLEGASATVEFSRDVSPDAPPTPPAPSPYALFAVTGDAGDQTTSASLANTQAFAFYTFAQWHFYTAPTNSVTADDAGRIMRLWSEGRLVQSAGRVSFVGSDSNKIFGSRTRSNTETSRIYMFEMGTVAYNNPLVDIVGLSFVVPGIATSGGDGSLRVGFVQSDASVDPGANMIDSQYAAFIPWREVYDRAGENLLGVTDVSVTDGTVTSVAVPIAKNPTKKFIWPVILPVAGLITATAGSVSSTSQSTVPPWRINSAAQ